MIMCRSPVPVDNFWIQDEITATLTIWPGLFPACCLFLSVRLEVSPIFSNPLWSLSQFWDLWNLLEGYFWSISLPSLILTVLLLIYILASDKGRCFLLMLPAGLCYSHHLLLISDGRPSFYDWFGYLQVSWNYKSLSKMNMLRWLQIFSQSNHLGTYGDCCNIQKRVNRSRLLWQKSNLAIFKLDRDFSDHYTPTHTHTNTHIHIYMSEFHRDQINIEELRTRGLLAHRLPWQPKF